MLQQIGQAISFDCFYQATDGQGVTGLTVTVDVWRGATQVVTDGAVTEVGGGFYTYALASGSVTNANNYRARFKTSSSSVAQKHQPALWIVGAVWVERVDAAISSRNAIAPDNASVATILTRTDVATSTRSSHTAANVRTEMDANSTKLDVATSTRMATFAYTAPDNAGITALGTALGVVDDLLDTEVAAIIASLLLVKAKTDLIGAASVTVTAAVSVDGTSINLYAGTDYHTTESREVTITDTSNSWPDLAGATVSFYVENEGSGVLFTKAMTVVVATGPGKQVKIEFTAANTITLRGNGDTIPGSAVVSTYAVTATLANTHKIAIVPAGILTVTSIADGAA